MRPATLEALLAHARALVGVELGELADALGLPVPVGRVRTKGWSGQVIEHELGVAVGGTRGPDFAALGIELKTVPVRAETLEPLESTAVCQIDPVAIAGESWDSSYVRLKLARVLFVALDVPDGARSVGERRVAAVRLWSPNAAEERRCAPTSSCSCATTTAAGGPPRSPATWAPCCRSAPRGATPPTRATPTTPQGRPTRVGKHGFYLRPAFVARLLGG